MDRDTRLNLVMLAILALAFIVVGTLDFQEEIRLEEAREKRAADLAAGYCLPRMGQRTVWEWNGEGESARLRCVVFDNVGYGRAPRVILDAEPAGLDRLALFRRDVD